MSDKSLLTLLCSDHSSISSISDPIHYESIVTLKPPEEPDYWDKIYNRLDSNPEDVYLHNPHGINALAFALCIESVPVYIIEKMVSISTLIVKPNAIIRALVDEHISYDILHILLSASFHSEPLHEFSPAEIDMYLEACEPRPWRKLDVDKLYLVLVCDPFVLSRIDENGLLPLQRACRNVYSEPDLDQVSYRALLIEFAIQGGVFHGYTGAGGLFATNLVKASAMNFLIENILEDGFDVARVVLQQCCEVVDIELYGRVGADCSSYSCPGFLHSSIGLVPPFFFRRLVQDRRFRNDLAKRDSFGNTPIIKAISIATRPNYYKEWNEMFYILLDPKYGGDRIARILSVNGLLPLHVAAERGLKWDQGMSQIFRASRKLLGRKKSGLYPFMLAATGKDSDLTSIYQLLLGNPMLCSGECIGDVDKCLERACKRARLLSL